MTKTAMNLRHGGSTALQSRVQLRRGFTLIELILAAIMISLLFSATYASLSQAVRTRDRTVARSAAFSRANAGADAIARDINNTIRSADLLESKVQIVRQGRAGAGLDGLLLFTHIDRPIRSNTGQAEGDECETQYRLEQSTNVPVRTSTADAKTLYSLWRRRAPVPDQYPDAGGVAVSIVDGVTALTVEAFDGSAWTSEWDSDSSGLPHAIRITITAGDDDGRSSVSARRVVAIDRVPIPPVAEDVPETGSTGTTGTGTGTSTQGGGTTGGTGGTGGQGGGGGGGQRGGGGGTR